MSLLDSSLMEEPTVCTTCTGDVTPHFPEDCPKRQHECPHCGYKDSHEEVKGSHLKECPQLIIPCTNEGCFEKITRISMMEHLGACSKGIISCPYSIVGCHKRFKREDASRHDNDHMSRHLELAVKSYKELKEKPPQLETLKEGELGSYVFKLKDFSELKQQGKHWMSPTFYTSLGGYKLALVVFPNGYNEDEGDHVSCIVCLLAGEYDAILEWPMKGEVKVELLNQLEDNNHTNIVLSVEEENEFFAVEDEEIVNIEEDVPGVGQSNMVEHSQLEYESDLNVRYLKDDCLYFRVTVTKLLTKQARPWLLTTQ